MKTKTFRVHSNLIREAVYDLLFDGDDVTKENIQDSIDKSIWRLIENGNTQLTLFPQDTYEQLVGDEYCKGIITIKELNKTTNKWISELYYTQEEKRFWKKEIQKICNDLIDEVKEIKSQEGWSVNDVEDVMIIYHNLKDKNKTLYEKVKYYDSCM